MFKITDKKGFHITFENGYTVSVQFGAGNYSENYNATYDENEKAGANGSATAECAVWGIGGTFLEHELFEGSTVGGYLTPNQVLELMNWASTRKN